jgi:hypothetical protein
MEGGPRSIYSLKKAWFNSNMDATEEHKHHSAQVLYLKYYYPKYSYDTRVNLDDQILVKQDTPLPRDLGESNGGYEESMQETV